MDCTKVHEKALIQKIKTGEKVSAKLKANYINSVLANDKLLAAKLISHYEPLLGVEYDSTTDQVLVSPVGNEKLLKAIDSEIEENQEITDSGVSKAFVSETEKHKISNVKIVASIISSIPYVKEIVKFDDINNTKYSFDGFLDYKSTYSVLKELFREKRNLKNINDFKALLENLLQFDNANLNETQRRIVLSVYLHLFNESPSANVYTDLYKNNIEKTSLYSQYRNSNDKEIKNKIDAIFSNILINLISVNDRSSLMIIGEEGMIYDFNDTTLKQRIDIQRQASINLYEYSITNESDSTIFVNESTINKFKEHQIKIFYDNGYKLGFVYDNKKFFIPFDLSKSSVETGINVVNFLDKMSLEISKSSNETNKDKINENKNRLISVLSDPLLIRTLFDITGFNMVNVPLINEMLNDKLISSPELRLENIYGILTSSLVGLSLNIQRDNSTDIKSKNTVYYPFSQVSPKIYQFLNKQVGDKLEEKDIERIQKEIDNGGNYDLSGVLISKKISKSVENSKNIGKILKKGVLLSAGLDKQDINTIFNNPLMFWLNTKYLAKKIADKYQLFRNESQYNINGDRVEKGNIISNIENIHRKVLEIRSTNNSIRFLNNILVKGEVKIQEIFRFDGFKSESKAKSQMSFNETDINYSVMKVFSEGIIKHYNSDTKQATLSYLFPEVYSDKSFFAALGLETTYNQFPLTENGKLDLLQLFKKFYKVEAENQAAFKANFINEWNGWIRKESSYLNSLGIAPIQFDINSISNLLFYIKTIPVPNKPISLLEEKYYSKINGSFGVKPLLEEYLLKEYDFASLENVSAESPLVKKDLINFLAYYAYNHNDSIKAGLSFSEESKQFLDDNNIYYNKSSIDKYSETKFDLSKYFVGNLVNDEFIISRDSNGEMLINPNIASNINNLYNEIIDNSNPFELSHFANYNILSPSISEIILGDVWQYKSKNKLYSGRDIEGALQDKLKRSVGAASPGTKMVLDTTLRDSNNLRIPEKSLILKIDDEKYLREVLGLGKLEDKELYDGGSITNPLSVAMYQASFGGNIGLYPNSSLKLIYSNSDSVNGDNQLIKYALHDLTEEHYDKGMSDVSKYYELMLGTLTFDRDVTVPVIRLKDTLGNIVDLPSKTFQSNQTIYDIFLDLRLEKRKNPDLRFNTFAILAEIVSTNKNQYGLLDLKNKVIPKIVFASSNKTGKSNMHNISDIRNSINGKYTTKNNEIVNIKDYLVEIDNNYLTMQLDATHSPDNPKVTKFSQAITNAVLEGRTPELAANMLNTEARITSIEGERMNRIFSKGEIDFVGDPKNNIDPDFDIFNLRLNNLKLNDPNRGEYDFKNIYDTLSEEDPSELKQALIEEFNSLNKDEKVKLILRYLILDNMDNQGQYNSTYEILDSNDFSYQDAQIIDKLNSTLNSYISKRTINTTFPGGNYILTPSTNLIGVVEVEREGVKHTVTLDKATEEEKVNARNLNWKGFLNKSTGESLFAKDDLGNYLNPVWSNFFKANSESERLIAKKELQKLFDSDEWELQPAEFIMPYPYKKNFGLQEGMQPIDVTVDYFVNIQGLPLPQATVKHANFQKSLEILVNRIPSTGMQSTVIGKIVGFFESSQNSLFFPIELMMIQGADLDIDKAVVIGRNFDTNGNYIQGDNVKGLQNEMIQSLYDIHGNPKNQIQSDTPVGFSSLENIKKLLDSFVKERLKFNPKLPMSVVRAKILTAEGKAMVGVFANGLKTFGILFHVAKQNLINGKNSPIKPLDLLLPNIDNFGNIQGFKRSIADYTTVANIDDRIEENKSQMWEFYSELVNAATDNAKEMILGAIGANLQTGNLINSMSLYGVKAVDMFKILTQPNIQKCLYYLRHSNDINNTERVISKIDEIIDTVFENEVLKDFNVTGKYNKEVKESKLVQLYNSARVQIKTPNKQLELDNQFNLLNTFKSMYLMGEEFSITAKMLGINRELPNTPYLKYKYNDGIENYINEGLVAFDNKDTTKFSLSEFVNKTEEEKAIWIDIYNKKVQKSINVLQILEQAPHIKEYLKVKLNTDNLLSDLFPLNNETINVLSMMKEIQGENSTPSEDVYNNIRRLLNEKIIFEFVKSKEINLKIDTDNVNFKLGSNSEINGFLTAYPNYLFNLINNGSNSELSNNEFFKSLQIITDKIGQYIGIPNIDSLDETRVFELLFEANKEIYNYIELNDGEFLNVKEFKDQLFLYSIITSKGKVSRSSFFELFDAKNRKDYVEFLKSNPNVLNEFNVSKETLVNNIDWIKANPNILSLGNNFIDKSTKKGNKIFPIKNEFINSSPKFITLFNKGVKLVYEKSVEIIEGKKEIVYSLVNSIYPVIAINAYNGIERVHYNETQTFKKIVDPKIAKDILKGLSVKLNLDIKPGRNSDTSIISSLGELKHDVANKTVTKKSKELNTNNLNLNRKVNIQLVRNIVDKLSKKFSVPVNYISDEKSDLKGYVDLTGKIFINLDKVTLDTALHEFGHIYLELLGKSNSQLKQRIINEALKDQSYITNLVKQKYSELPEQDLGEEIFVTHLGMSANDTDYINYLELNNSKGLKQVILDFFDAIKSALSSIGLVKGKGLKIDSNSTFLDLIEGIKYDILSDNDLSFKLATEDINLLKSFKQSKDLTVTSINEFINSLIPYDKNTKEIKPKSEYKKYVDIINLLKSNTVLTAEQLKSKAKRDFKVSNETFEQAENIFKKITENSENNFTLTNYQDVMLLSDLHEHSYTYINRDNKTVKVKSYPDVKENPYEGQDNILVIIDRDSGKKEISLFDISLSSLNTQNILPSNNTNVFGSIISDSTANKLGIDFTNKQTHVNALKLGLLGMQVKNALSSTKDSNAGIKIIQSFAQSDGVKKDGYFIDDVIRNLQKALKDSKFKDNYGDFLNSFINEETDPETYRINIMKLYINYLNIGINSSQSKIDSIGLSETEKKVLSKYRDSDIKLRSLLEKNQNSSEVETINEIIEIVSARQAELIKNEDSTGPVSDVNKRIKEFNRILLLELIETKGAFQAHNASLLSGLNLKVARIGATGNQVLDKFYEMITNAMSKAQNYLNSFRSEFNPLLEKLMKDYNDRNGFIKGGLETFTLNDARKFFNNMLEKVEAVNSNGETVLVNTGKLWSKDSEQYNNLSEVEKEFMRFFNEKVKDAANLASKTTKRQLHTDDYIPLMRLNAGYKNIDNISEIKNISWNKLREDFKNAADYNLSTGFENGEFFVEDKVKDGVSLNLFEGQFQEVKKDGTYSKYGKGLRMNTLGLIENNNKLVLVDENRNKSIEGDLSIVLHNFVFSQAKHAEFKKIEPITEAIRSCLRFRNSVLGKTDFSLEFADEFYKKYVNNINADKEGMELVAKIMYKLQSQSSLVTLGFNVGSAVANLGSATASTIKEAMYNTISSLTGGNPPFNLIDLGKAFVIVGIEKFKNIQNQDKIDAINAMYKITNQDVAFLQNNIPTQKGVLKTKNAYWFNTVGDKFNREVLITAQMISDGSYDAYTFENGKLSYDETKDKRFYKNGVFDPNHLLLKVLKNEMLKSGEGIEKGMLTQGYSRLQRNSMKALSDRVYGSYDDENSAKIANYAMGRLFLSFKKYMVDKGRIYFGAKIFTENDGEYVPIYKDNDPKKEIIGYAPIGREQEGVWWTLIRVTKELGKYKNLGKTWNQLKPFEKQNLRYLLNDAMFLSILMVGFYALFDDEETKEENPYMLKFYKGFLDTASLNMIFGFSNFTETPTFVPQFNMVVKPFMVTSYLEKQLRNFTQITLGAGKAINSEDEEKKLKAFYALIQNMPTQASSIIRVSSQAKSYYDEFLDIEENE